MCLESWSQSRVDDWHPEHRAAPDVFIEETLLGNLFRRCVSYVRREQYNEFVAFYFQRGGGTLKDTVNVKRGFACSLKRRYLPRIVCLHAKIR